MAHRPVGTGVTATFAAAGTAKIGGPCSARLLRISSKPPSGIAPPSGIGRFMYLLYSSILGLYRSPLSLRLDINFEYKSSRPPKPPKKYPILPPSFLSKMV